MACCLGELGVDDFGDRHRQIRQYELVGAWEVDAEGVIVDDDELIGRFHLAGAHLDRREAADRNRAVERPFDVLGGDRRAVVESGVLAQMEGHRLSVRRQLPAFGEFGRELSVIVAPASVGKLLASRG